MRAGNNSWGCYYYIGDVSTDLPLYIADTFEEAREWIGCSPAKFVRMIREGAEHKGMFCRKMRDL